MLKHTLVYQVEHVFLIHRHTGLLISHVAAEDAASQDPQLISSMLVAIQDFVRDSFSGAGQGVDTLMLGELKLWCEPGPFAMLVAVIRGDPPEEFHDTLRQALTRMHAERHAALESFDGDSSGFADIEAELRECLTGQRQSRPRPARFGRLIFMAWLVVMLGIAGAFGWRWWESGRLWQSYIEQLRVEPGIVVTEVSERNGKLTVSGLRDPLAIDPQALLKQMGINPDTVVSRWERYEAMQPQFVTERLKSALEPPPSVTLAVEGDRTVAQGKAPTDWLTRAKSAAKALPAGAPTFDVSAVQDTDETGTRLWNDYISRLGAEPGIVITENGRRDGTFFVSGLRDPLSADPATLLRPGRCRSGRGHEPLDAVPVARAAIRAETARGLAGAAGERGAVYCRRPHRRQGIGTIALAGRGPHGGAAVAAGSAGLRSFRRQGRRRGRHGDCGTAMSAGFAPSPASSLPRQASATASSSSPACAIRSRPIRKCCSPRPASIRPG